MPHPSPPSPLSPQNQTGAVMVILHLAHHLLFLAKVQAHFRRYQCSQVLFRVHILQTIPLYLHPVNQALNQHLAQCRAPSRVSILLCFHRCSHLLYLQKVLCLVIHHQHQSTPAHCLARNPRKGLRRYHHFFQAIPLHLLQAQTPAPYHLVLLQLKTIRWFK